LLGNNASMKSVITEQGGRIRTICVCTCEPFYVRLLFVHNVCTYVSCVTGRVLREKRKKEVRESKIMTAAQLSDNSISESCWSVGRQQQLCRFGWFKMHRRFSLFTSRETFYAFYSLKKQVVRPNATSKACVAKGRVATHLS